MRNYHKLDRISTYCCKIIKLLAFPSRFIFLVLQSVLLSSQLCEANALSTSEALTRIQAILNVYFRPPSICEVPPFLANFLRNFYLKKSIDFARERTCLRNLVAGIVIVGMQPHRVIGFSYAVDSSDVKYQLRRD